MSGGINGKRKGYNAMVRMPSTSGPNPFGSPSGQQPAGNNWFDGNANTGGTNWATQFWKPNTSYSSGVAGMGNNGAQPSSYGYDGTGNNNLDGSPIGGDFDFGNFDFGNFMNQLGGYFSPPGAYGYGMDNAGQGNVGGYTMSPTTPTGNNIATPATAPVAPDLGDPRVPPEARVRDWRAANWDTPAVTTYGRFKTRDNKDLRSAIQDLRKQNSWVDALEPGDGNYGSLLQSDPRRNQFDNKRDFLIAEAKWQQQRENMLNSSGPEGWGLQPGTPEWEAYRMAQGLPANYAWDQNYQWSPTNGTFVNGEFIPNPGTYTPYTPGVSTNRPPIAPDRPPLPNGLGGPLEPKTTPISPVPRIDPKPTPTYLQGGNGGGNRNSQPDPFRNTGRK